jgi:Glycosyltransferase family 25 (LPS biosynthesis protein)
MARDTSGGMSYRKRQYKDATVRCAKQTNQFTVTGRPVCQRSKQLRVNVINLDRSEDRRTEFTTLNAHLADVARFPAIDGQRLEIASLVRRNAMSHIALWDRAIESGQNLTICEDDAIFNTRWIFVPPKCSRDFPPSGILYFGGGTSIFGGGTSIFFSASRCRRIPLPRSI